MNLSDDPKTGAQDAVSNLIKGNKHWGFLKGQLKQNVKFIFIDVQNLFARFLHRKQF